MVANSDFNFTTNELVTLRTYHFQNISKNYDNEFFHIFWIILLLTCAAFVDVKLIVQVLELPVSNVKFFQLSPGEYFVSTVKNSILYRPAYSEVRLQWDKLILFLLPGLTKKETKVILTIVVKLTKSLWCWD